MEAEALFNLGTVENSSKGFAEEGVHYKLLKNKNGGIPLRIFNFDNPDICPRVGIIELEAFKVSRASNGNRRHDPFVKFDKVYDVDNNIIIGIPKRLNPKTDEWEFETIILRGSEVFNLANPQDAMKWAVIKNSYYVEGSPNADRKLVTYKVYDKEKEAQIYLSKINIKRKAETIAQGLFGEQLVEAAISLGVEIHNMSEAVLSMTVCKISENDPKRFMDVWDSPNKLEITVFKKALTAGIIVQDVQLGFVYNGLQLGINEPQAIDYFKQNPQVRHTIDMLSKQKESDSVKAMNKKTTLPIKDEKDARIAELESRLAAAEKNIKEVSHSKIEAITETLLDNLNVSPDDELESLKLEARRLKVQGWAVTKDKEVLRQKIKDKISQAQN